MAEIKPENLATDQLVRRKKIATISIAVSSILFLACLAVLLLLKPDLSGISIPILAPAVLGVKERRNITRILKTRESARI